MNLQSTILFTVHDFRQKSTAVFLHFKLLLYSPLFYFTIHNFTLQSTILIYSPYIVNMWLENVILQYICVQTFTLLSIILLYSPQIYFAVHNISLQSTILFTVHNFDLQSIYCQHLVRNCHFTVYMIAHFYFTVHNFSLQSKKFLYSPQLYFAVHDFTLQSTIFPNT